MRVDASRIAAVTGGLLAGGVLGAGFVWALDSQDYNVWGATLVIPLVILVNLPLLHRVTRREPDPWIARIIVLGFSAKLIGTAIRYYTAYVVYDGAADAEQYNQYAAFKYLLWRQGDLDIESVSAKGTWWLQIMTTAVYTVIGPSPLAAFFVFSSFAFWGAYLLYRAFRIALPQGDARLYAGLVFLLPSMLYWPSSIGKEAWLLLVLGVTALGAAKFFSIEQRSGALPLLVVGIGCTTLVRPHLALLLVGGLATAQLFRPTAKRSTDFFSKLLGIAILGAAATLLASQSAAFLGIDDFSWQAISEQLQERGANATQGGSAFEAVPALTPWTMPWAFVTVVFRPFPLEADNLQLFVQSLEGTGLLYLAWRQRRRLRTTPHFLRTNPYVTFAVVHALSFVWAFSSIGNFGILARQRVLMIPLLLVLVALPNIREVPHERTRRRTHAHVT